MGHERRPRHTYGVANRCSVCRELRQKIARRAISTMGARGGFSDLNESDLNGARTETSPYLWRRQPMFGLSRAQTKNCSTRYIHNGSARWIFWKIHWQGARFYSPTQVWG